MGSRIIPPISANYCAEMISKTVYRPVFGASAKCTNEFVENGVHLVTIPFNIPSASFSSAQNSASSSLAGLGGW